MRNLLLCGTVLVGLGSAPTPAIAGDACDNAWFTRNLIAHRGGHCFTSNLGKGMFGNGSCSSTGVKLSKAQRDQMAAIKQMEKSWGCNVDTSRRTVPIYNRDLLEKLDVFPVRDDTESGCINYLGADIVLRAAPKTTGRIIGKISIGSSVGDSHLTMGNWSYNEVFRSGEMVASGWHQTNIWDGQCENYAG